MAALQRRKLEIDGEGRPRSDHGHSGGEFELTPSGAKKPVNSTT